MFSRAWRQVHIGCGHTIELNRDLASKSRLTSNHDLAEIRDLIYFWSNHTELIAICHCLNLSIMRHRSLSLYCMPVTELVVVFTNLRKTYFYSSRFYIVLSFIPLLDI